MTRKTTEQEKKVFSYLNKLRESGATNMFGAAPYVVSKFGVKPHEARSLLTTWMRVFNNAGNYEEIETN